VAVVAGLALAAFMLRSTVAEGEARPLYAHDKMVLWRSATPAVKQATAEILVDELERGGKLGASKLTTLSTPGGKQAFAVEIVAALDEATNQNRKTYVSPADPLLHTLEGIAAKKGWDK
jgi:membrane-bound ClpP family serine protease